MKNKKFAYESCKIETIRLERTDIVTSSTDGESVFSSENEKDNFFSSESNFWN